MQEFTSKDSKKILLDIVKPYFKREGFKFISGGSPGYVKETEFGYIDVIFAFGSHASMGYVDFIPTRLYIREVESIMDENSFPGREKWQIAEGMWRLTTVKDSKTELYEFNKRDPVNTELKTLNFAHSIINYMDNGGREFINHYRFLPNILLEINRLLSLKVFPFDILCGGLDYFFKMLIISKLCNDPHYLIKESFADKNIYEDNRKEWIPYYEKLKTKLSTLEPRYNL